MQQKILIKEVNKQIREERNSLHKINELDHLNQNQNHTELQLLHSFETLKLINAPRPPVPEPTPLLLAGKQMAGKIVVSLGFPLSCQFAFLTLYD